MGRGYSLDLRERVIKYLEQSKGNQAQAAEQFLINVRTVKRWVRRNKTGCLEQDKQGPKNTKKVNREVFQSYVESHGDQTLKEIGEYFSLSINGVWKIMKELSFVYKKNATIRRTRRKKKS